jgi:hypothetical protein
MVEFASIPGAPIIDGGTILRIRRDLVVVLLLALALTGVLLATLAGTAGSVPKPDTTVITPAEPSDKNVQPGGMGYDVRPDGMGYDSVQP